MKKVLTGLLGGLLVLLLASGMAMAYTITYTYADTVKDWPGHETAFNDQIGSPRVETMYVTITDGYLDKVEIEVRNRQLWDTLFINAKDAGAEGYTYEQWDYYVLSTSGGSSIFEVAEDYEYIKVKDTMNGQRAGHPAGINDDYLTAADPSILASVTWIDDLLVYDFSATGIYVGSSFAIGYSQYCANDVHLAQLTPVPEPMTMLLLGFGLLGLGLARRKS